MSNLRRLRMSSASSPLPHTVTLYPSCCSMLEHDSRNVRSSSTINRRRVARTSGFTCRRFASPAGVSTLVLVSAGTVVRTADPRDWVMGGSSQGSGHLRAHLWLRGCREERCYAGGYSTIVATKQHRCCYNTSSVAVTQRPDPDRLANAAGLGLLSNDAMFSCR